MLASAVTISELAATMERAKFDRYASLGERREFVAFVSMAAHFVEVRRLIRSLQGSQGRQVPRRCRQRWRGCCRHRRRRLANSRHLRGNTNHDSSGLPWQVEPMINPAAA